MINNGHSILPAIAILACSSSAVHLTAQGSDEALISHNSSDKSFFSLHSGHSSSDDAPVVAKTMQDEFNTDTKRQIMVSTWTDREHQQQRSEDAAPEQHSQLLPMDMLVSGKSWSGGVNVGLIDEAHWEDQTRDARLIDEAYVDSDTLTRTDSEQKQMMLMKTRTTKVCVMAMLALEGLMLLCILRFVYFWFLGVDVTDAGLAQLKAMIDEKGPVRVSRSPDVFVTLQYLRAGEGGSVTVHPTCFMMKNIEFHSSIEIRGSKADIMKKLAASAAASAAATAASVAVNAGTTAVRAIRRPANCLECHCVGNTSEEHDEEENGFDDEDDMAFGETIEEAEKRQAFSVSGTVDIEKPHGSDDVSVTTRVINTDNGLFKAMLSNNQLRSYLELAMSSRATDAATKMSKRTVPVCCGSF